jgi:HEPN domain-containing protein
MSATKKQTAVQWLVEKLMKGDFVNNPDELIEQAKAMEKEQIVDAYTDGYSDSDNKLSFNKQYYIENYETIRKP